MRSSARTASATTSAFRILSMDREILPSGAGDYLGPDRAESRVDRVPVQGVEPGCHIVRAPVLVLQVVGVLPDVNPEDRRELVHVRAVLVGKALDRELALAVGDQPRPTAAELAHRGPLSPLLDRLGPSERAFL